jgi:hypothetical protein
VATISLALTKPARRSLLHSRIQDYGIDTWHTNAPNGHTITDLRAHYKAFWTCTLRHHYTHYTRIWSLPDSLENYTTAYHSFQYTTTRHSDWSEHMIRMITEKPWHKRLQTHKYLLSSGKKQSTLQRTQYQVPYETLYEMLLIPKPQDRRWTSSRTWRWTSHYTQIAMNFRHTIHTKTMLFTAHIYIHTKVIVFAVHLHIHTQAPVMEFDIHTHTERDGLNCKHTHTESNGLRCTHT